MVASLQCRCCHGWRSSGVLVTGMACVALLTETLLYGFLVPILPYMLEVRLRADPAQTQNLTSGLLSMHGLVTLISTPVIATAVDKIASRKIPLLLSQVACIAGTLLVAFTPTFWALYLGRMLQAVTGAITCTICVAMLTSNASEMNAGKMLGLSASCIMAGKVAGPMIAGVLLEWGGYWQAWSVPFGLLLLDTTARFLIIEPGRLCPLDSHAQQSYRKQSGHTHTSEVTEDTETTPILSAQAKIAETDSEASDPQPAASFCNFYRKMLSDIRVLASLTNTIVCSMMVASFSTTLPAHLGHVFKWGPSSVGMIFFLMQTPTIVLGPLSGWLRDRIGLRYPTTAGWTLLASMMCILGIPSGLHFLGDGAVDYEKRTFISCMAGVAIALPLIQGAGLFQMLTRLRCMESKQPNIFGAHGGRSRAFAMNSVGFNLGLMVGPLISDGLSDSIGYYHMNVALAAVCLGTSLVSLNFF